MSDVFWDQTVEPLTKFSAESSTFQGAKPHTPIVTAISWPLKMFIYFGAKLVRSLAAEIEFAVL